MAEQVADVKKTPKQLRQFIACIIVNINGLSYGYVLGWTTNAVSYLQGPESPLPLTSDEASWMAALLLLGGFTATPIFSVLPDRIGRKMAGYITALFMIVGWIVVIVASNATHLYIGRFLSGVCGGGFLVVSPLYVVEIADTNIRGMLGSFYIMHYNGAIAIAYILGAFISYESSQYVGLALPIVFLCLFFWLPETPKYLIRNGKMDEAEKSIRWFRGADHDVSREIESIKESIRAIESTHSDSTSLKEIIFSKAALRGFFIVTVLALNHQTSGIAAVISYTTKIFEEAGSTLEPKYCTIIVGFLQFAGNLAAIFLVERTGRKALLLLSDSVMAASLFTLGLYFYLKNIGMDLVAVSWLPVLCLSTFVVALSLGLGPLIYVVLTEIIPSPVLWIAQKICYCILWFLAFIMTKYFYVLAETIGMDGSFWFFSVCCVLPMLVIIFQLPETKNKSFETIQMEMRGVKTIDKTLNSSKV